MSSTTYDLACSALNPQSILIACLQALAEQAAAAAARGTLPAGPLAAAIVVPTLAALALLTAVGMVWLRKRHSMQQHQHSINNGQLLSQLPCADGGNHVQRWLDAGGGQGDGPET